MSDLARVLLFDRGSASTSRLLAALQRLAIPVDREIAPGTSYAVVVVDITRDEDDLPMLDWLRGRPVVIAITSLDTPPTVDARLVHARVREPIDVLMLAEIIDACVRASASETRRPPREDSRDRDELAGR